ncbi:MAG TPA: hypothetical protein G4O09_04635 [Dehalococcoidia bacterium]|nr:hypothetical protein [Dehalococcoidia bacterium]
MHGWTGKILRVNLSSSEIKQISTEPYAERYLGGRGIATRLYWETVTPEIEAFDPANRLIFMTGPLVATGVPGATRMTVVGKSPMTYPEGFCYGNVGGFFPAELKKAGYDGVIIEGRAAKPVYLWINDNEAELRDASSLWGQGVYRAGEMLQQVRGKNVCYLSTGVAGERKVRTAVIAGSHHSSSTGGYGAVMGAKNFKAIAVTGTGKPSVANPAKLKELIHHTAKINKHVKFVIPRKVAESGASSLLEAVGKGHCYQCGLDCLRGRYIYGQRLEGDRKCQAMEYYLPWLYSKKDEPIETFFDAPILANDYSICTFELESMIDWLYDCHLSGSLTDQETGLPLSKIGTREFLEKLLHSIAYREGFGDILAEGMVRASEKVPKKAGDILSYTIAPVGKNDLNPARAYIVNSLLDPMEPRVHRPLNHRGLAWIAWGINQSQPDLSPVTTSVMYKIAKAFWGSEEAGDESSYDGKALAAVKVQNRTYIEDSLGLCDSGWPITYSLNTPDSIGDPDMEAKIFSAVTGAAAKDIDRYGEVICNLQRAILIREGREIPEADFPLDFNFTEPLKGEQPVMVPGPDGKAVDMRGNTLDRERFARMLREYYRFRGWDEETGRPRPETLAALGLDDLAT